MTHVNVVEDNGLGPAIPVFTHEQYGQILRLLNKENTNMPAVNQTGTNTLFSIGTNIKQWVVDSGATKHTTVSLDELFDIIALEQGDHTQVQLPNGTTTSISYTGSYNWGNGDLLTNVLVVPDFHYDLLSVSQLTRKLHCSDLSTGKVKGIGKETGGLYFLLNKGVGDRSRLNKAMAAKVEVVEAQLMHFKTTKDETVLWHRRLGHPSFATLRKLVPTTDNHLDDCLVCPLAKQTRLPFPVSSTRSSSMFELLHIDVWGPYRISTHAGYRHISEVARAIRFQGGIPIKFWGECVLAAVYLINRLPTPTLNGKSPYEIFYKKKPSLDHLRNIGCLCFATTLVRKDKFSARASACVLLGYSLTQKGYPLYNIIEKRFIVSRDMVFKESVFPFKHLPDTLPQSLFPDTSQFTELELIPLAEVIVDPEPDREVHNTIGMPTVVEDDSDNARTQDNVEEPEVMPPVMPYVTRKSSRVVIKPAWHQDYVTATKKTFQ
ncbi:hypothetical protein KY289_011200 [Solanum tuberosum]|nr:hypothetical protein KY289_011200 [Solanum tuberosum]